MQLKFKIFGQRSYWSNLMAVDLLVIARMTVWFFALLNEGFFTDSNPVHSNWHLSPYNVAVSMVLAAVLPGTVALGAVLLVIHFACKRKTSNQRESHLGLGNGMIWSNYASSNVLMHFLQFVLKFVIDLLYVCGLLPWVCYEKTKIGLNHLVKILSVTVNFSTRPFPCAI